MSASTRGPLLTMTAEDIAEIRTWTDWFRQAGNGSDPRAVDTLRVVDMLLAEITAAHDRLGKLTAAVRRESSLLSGWAARPSTSGPRTPAMDAALRLTAAVDGSR